jgi:uncharacterized protein YqeY
MNLIEQINADFMTAYKESKTDEAKKEVKNFLGVLKTEVTRETKKPNDAYVIGKIKSMIKNAADTNSLSETELAILDKYLPSQMDEAKLTEVITGFLSENEGANIGQVMGFLKTEYAGQYDGRLASEVVKKLV